MPVGDFWITAGRGHTARYRVRVVPVREGGYRAKLISEDIGTIMEPSGKTPEAALTTLVRELAKIGDAYDKKLAREIAKSAWFPLETH